MAFQKMAISFYYLQFLYYLLSMCVLALGLAWAVSALNPFIRDINQIVAVVLQIGFWATPIFWDINIMPSKIQLILKLNPIIRCPAIAPTKPKGMAIITTKGWVKDRKGIASRA